eukprot:2008160-Lingulodinium_polyedra.AAC.1
MLVRRVLAKGHVARAVGAIAFAPQEGRGADAGASARREWRGQRRWREICPSVAARPAPVPHAN